MGSMVSGNHAGAKHMSGRFMQTFPRPQDQWLYRPTREMNSSKRAGTKDQLFVPLDEAMSKSWKHMLRRSTPLRSESWLM
jgi:hypothetical protein